MIKLTVFIKFTLHVVNVLLATFDDIINLNNSFYNEELKLNNMKF